jgi:NDP-sugar pyrophosphorylase family protein
MDKTEIVILCGGKGTRATYLPLGLPKCLAPIDGRPFLDILLEQIETEFPKQKITLATGHLACEVEWFAKHRMHGNLEVVEDKDQNGTAQCAYWLTMRSKSADTLFINGDTYQEDSLAAMIERHRSNWCAPMTVSVQSHGPCRGIFILTQQRIAGFKNTFQDKNLDEMFCIDMQRNIGSVKFAWTESPFFDIGTPEGYERFKAFWKEREQLRSLSELRTGYHGSAEGQIIRRTS